jgi:hypothetical protein
VQNRAPVRVLSPPGWGVPTHEKTRRQIRIESQCSTTPSTSVGAVCALTADGRGSAHDSKAAVRPAEVPSAQCRSVHETVRRPLLDLRTVTRCNGAPGGIVATSVRARNRRARILPIVFSTELHVHLYRSTGNDVYPDERIFGHPWEQTLCVFGPRLVNTLGATLSSWLPRLRVDGKQQR